MPASRQISVWKSANSSSLISVTGCTGPLVRVAGAVDTWRLHLSSRRFGERGAIERGHAQELVGGEQPVRVEEQHEPTLDLSHAAQVLGLDPGSKVGDGLELAVAHVDHAPELRREDPEARRLAAPDEVDDDQVRAEGERRLPETEL